MENESEDIFADEGLQTAEEEELTALEVLERMETAWTNEKFAPELLPPVSDVLECLLERISTDDDENIDKLESPIRRMETERIRYLISSYLRLRLEKIERSPMNSSMAMTLEESRFRSKYEENLRKLFRRTVTEGMPGDFGDESKLIPEENSNSHLDKHVFIHVLEDVPEVVLRDETGNERDERVDLEKGSQHILRYKDIRELLHKGLVRLI